MEAQVIIDESDAGALEYRVCLRLPDGFDGPTVAAGIEDREDANMLALRLNASGPGLLGMILLEQATPPNELSLTSVEQVALQSLAVRIASLVFPADIDERVVARAIPRLYAALASVWELQEGELLHSTHTLHGQVAQAFAMYHSDAETEESQ